MNVHKQSTGERMTKEKLELHLNILAAAVAEKAFNCEKVDRKKQQKDAGIADKTKNKQTISLHATLTSDKITNIFRTLSFFSTFFIKCAYKM